MPIGPSGGSSGGGGTVLFDSTLGAGSLTIDTGANGVAAGSSHLSIIILARVATAAASDGLNINLNNDSGANYDYVLTRNLTGTVADVHATAQTAATLATIPANTATASYFAAIRITIPSYTQTTAFKVAELTAGAFTVPATPAYSVSQGMFTWRSTAAITRIAITCATGATNLSAGSRMTVYGLT